MSRDWRLLAASAAVALVLGAALRSGGILDMALVLIPPLLLPFVGTRKRGRIELERQIAPSLTEAGRPVSVRLRGSLCLSERETALIRERPPAGLSTDGPTETLVHSSRDGVFELIYRVSGGRGIYLFPDVTVQRNDLWGLGEKVEETKVSADPGSGSTGRDLTLIPAPPVFREINPQPERILPYSGTFTSPLSGRGIAFSGTRYYSPGDSMRQINWRASSRRGRLVSNLFSVERAFELTIVLDARIGVAEGGVAEELFEHSVAAAHALARRSLAEGNRVSLLVYGGIMRWVHPGSGRYHRFRLDRELAAARLADHVAFRSFDNLPLRSFLPRSSIVVVTALLPGDVEDLLRIKSEHYDLLLISPDVVKLSMRRLTQNVPRRPGAEIAGRLSREVRSTAMAILRSAGVPVLDWDTDESLFQQRFVGPRSSSR